MRLPVNRRKPQSPHERDNALILHYMGLTLFATTAGALVLAYLEKSVPEQLVLLPGIILGSLGTQLVQARQAAHDQQTTITAETVEQVGGEQREPEPLPEKL